MRRWIIWIIILLALAAGGFCLYWFVFRDTSDGGNLSNKETLFAVQNILKDNNTELDDIFENHKNVTFSSTQNSNLFVSAEEEEKPSLSENFSGLLSENSSITNPMSKEHFKSAFERPLIFAYAALYENNFNKQNNIKQNKWLEQSFSEKVDEENTITKTYKLKIWTGSDKTIYIWFYDEYEHRFDEMTIKYNFRNETNVYSIECKTTITNEKELTENEQTKDSYTYQYAYFERTSVNVSDYSFVNFTSKMRITQIQKDYSMLNMNVNCIYLLKDNKKLTLTSTPTEDNKIAIRKYIVEDLDTNFHEQDKSSSAKTTKIKAIEAAHNYFN